MEVCGVDPGLKTTGYAVLTINGNVTSVREAGICQTDNDASLAERLAQLQRDFEAVIKQCRPSVMGVEQLYGHYRHPRTAILMGHARGVILAVAARFGVEVRDLAATQVKRYLTGNGRASKAQMQRAVKAALGLKKVPEPNDVADALAVALCCADGLSNKQPETLEP